MPIFQNLDLLFAFVSLMLAAGTVVATCTQLATEVAGLRSRFLQRALEELLTQLDPLNISPMDARELASSLIRHPWLCGRTLRPVSALRREDFVRLLIDLCASQSPRAIGLRRSFGFGNLEEAQELVQSIGREALRLEAECPSESARERDVRAILSALGTRPLLASVYAWYGHAMARATRRYQRYAHIVTASFALILVLALRLNLLQFFGIHAASQWPGLTLSWILLSLGTPFWYDRLKDLLHFRPSLD